MPELPEVESVLRALKPIVVGQKIKTPQCFGKGLRTHWPENFCTQLEGKTVQHLERRAKYMLFTLSSGHSWIVHLGMTGAFSVLPAHDLPPHTRMVFQAGNGPFLAYTDPRKFGFMDVVETQNLPTHPQLCRLGPEPLTLDEKTFFAALSKRTGPIKPVLMDQKMLVGVGNIYASESLFYARIHPATPANTLSKQQVKILLKCIKTVLNQSINAGGSTLRNYKTPDGTLGSFQENFAVYGRASALCQTCGNPVQKILQTGRSTFFCACCQAL